MAAKSWQDYDFIWLKPVLHQKQPQKNRAVYLVRQQFHEVKLVRSFGCSVSTLPEACLTPEMEN